MADDDSDACACLIHVLRRLETETVEHCIDMIEVACSVDNPDGHVHRDRALSLVASIVGMVVYKSEPDLAGRLAAVDRIRSTVGVALGQFELEGLPSAGHA